MSNVTNEDIMIVDENNIKDKIYLIRGQKVMLDFDLAEIYGFTTKRFNQQINRNIERFPDDFMFQITKEESDNLGGHILQPHGFMLLVMMGDVGICLMLLPNKA